MSLLTERDSKGNSKGIKNIYHNLRGFVEWICNVTSDAESRTVSADVWRNFVDDVLSGQLKAGDSIERYLIKKTICKAVNGISESEVTDNFDGIKTIKFPGDLDVAKRYIRSMFEGMTKNEALHSLLAIAGYGYKDDIDARGLIDAAGKKIADGKYNLNVPTPEMCFDVLTRSAQSLESAGEPDTAVLQYIDTACSKRTSAKPTKQKDVPAKGFKGKWAFALAALCLIVLGIVIYNGLNNNVNTLPDSDNTGIGTYDGPTNIDDGDENVVHSLEYHVVIEVENYGTIELELDHDAAPRTVKNFIDLVKDKFYDGLTFHRIIDGFVLQGGDPTGTGSGGSDKKIIGEFADNGVENPISHKRGVISMARSSNDYNSARSQFFICQQDCSKSLDGHYAAFGYVTSGMDVVDRICADAKPIDDNGTIPAEEQPVITSIRLITEEE